MITNVGKLINNPIIITDTDNIGKVSVIGRQKINKLLIDNELPALPSSESGNWSWNIKNNCGSLAKRYKKYVLLLIKSATIDKTKFQELIPTDSFLAQLGQQADKYKITEEQSVVCLQAVKSPFDWHNNGFGHPGGSCWFSEKHPPRNSALFDTQKDMFGALGGLAMLFYSGDKVDETKGLGRLWAYQYEKNKMIVFNGYMNGGRNSSFLVNTLAKALQTSYIQVRLFSDSHFINDDIGFMYTDEPWTEKLDIIMNLRDNHKIDKFVAIQ